MILTPSILLVILTAESARFLNGGPVIPERWNVWFVAFCFGVQSAVTFPAMGVPTMLATGHLTNIFYTGMEVFLREKPREDLVKTIYPLVNAGAILIGAAAGAAANLHSKGSVASAFLLTPITLLQVILLETVEYMIRDEGAVSKEFVRQHSADEPPKDDSKKTS